MPSRTPVPRAFSLTTEYDPAGDQPQAIDELLSGLRSGDKHQILLGITGSGKTYTMANVIEKWGRPTLILAHNKTLAAQLYGEFKSLFPDNAVHYFVSYYDYYQPEAYIPASDTYIEKDSQINEEIDRLRHAATNALLTRRDVIIVASVSCIFGIGSPEFYSDLAIDCSVGQEIDRDKFLRLLVNIQYERNDYDFYRGTFRVRGDIVEVFPADADRWAYRIEWFGDEIESISTVDPFLGETGTNLEQVHIFPSTHYVVPRLNLEQSIDKIRDELRERLIEFNSQNKLLEAQRLELRTMADLELLEATGYCRGIENYSRFFDGRQRGVPPATLIDYFPDDFLLFIDESHQTLPQVRAMYKGDRSRKENLVEFGFRVPSAMDNRPLQFHEFNERINQVIYVSATPGDYEVETTSGVIVEQIVRPTGLLDPEIEIRQTQGQLDDLLNEITARTRNGEKILVVTLTKRMSEHLTEYYAQLGVRVRYLHSEIDTLERMELLRDLRQNEYDVLVGINLLREGLDLPEVTLVAILDADVEGFLRSARSLFQICGRASRNAKGRVIMYADKVTPSMDEVIKETGRRRAIQQEHNRKLGITPMTIIKKVNDITLLIGRVPKALPRKTPTAPMGSVKEMELFLLDMRKKMREHARKLEFEEAARLRDEISDLEKMLTY
ncbi:excinuclease ABC subunit UvrB [Myxococcota bacterium]|nr:excinuclease ABC subunit UvrB [Myxococcota bacterium]MBU1534781.1 excinuclease ABC subunit UvrB [Myxococcota bacterium]